MDNGRIVTALVAAFLASSAAAEPTVIETQPIEGDPFRDFRIEECEGTRGFGLFAYTTSDSVFRLSDICVLENTGDVFSVETLRGLQLTKKSSEGRSFEDLNSGKSQYERNSISFFPDGYAPGCTPEPVETIEFNIPNSSHIQRVPKASFLNVNGYTVPAVSSRPAEQSMEIYLGIRAISQEETGSSTMKSPVVNGFGDMYAEAEFSDSGGTVTITKGYGYSYGDAGGGLEIQLFENGQFQAEGTFTAKSVRIAGHEPHEMVTISGEIPYMRGHILGSNGAEMLGFGLVTGTYEDASGQTHSYRAAAHLIACASGSGQ